MTGEKKNGYLFLNLQAFWSQCCWLRPQRSSWPSRRCRSRRHEGARAGPLHPPASMTRPSPSSPAASPQQLRVWAPSLSPQRSRRRRPPLRPRRRKLHHLPSPPRSSGSPSAEAAALTVALDAGRRRLPQSYGSPRPAGSLRQSRSPRGTTVGYASPLKQPPKQLSPKQLPLGP